MFKDLNEINWSKLEHAYGSAEDVPMLLRQRASPDPEEASEAGQEFFGNIWHQGTVYEATAYAVPFLVELLARRETYCRLELVFLLGSIATGSSYREVHGNRLRKEDAATFAEELAKELTWKRAAHDAVGRYAEVYWELLDDAEIQVGVPYLMAHLAAEAGRVGARYPERIARTEDPLFRASLLVGLAYAAREAGESAELLASFLDDEAPLIALSGAFGVLVNPSRSARMDHAIEIYFDAFKDDERLEMNDERWLWGEGNLRSLLLDGFTMLSPQAAEAVRAILPSKLPKLERYDATEVAHTNMALGFDMKHLPRSKGELNHLQIALLTALSRETKVIYSDPLIMGIQKALGLSQEIRELKEFLEE